MENSFCGMWRIYEDDLTGEVLYYVATSDQWGNNDEIVAHGSGNDWDDAKKQVTEAIASLL